MNVRRRAADRTTRGASSQRESRSDLKFVGVGVGKNASGGWYRELPNRQIEVMSRGQLKRVPLGNSDPEEKAKTVLRGIFRRHH